VELSGKRSSLFEITITEKALPEFLIWVNHSPMILLGVTLRLLWVNHIPTILLIVSFRSLSSRPLRGFIYSIFFSCYFEMAEEGFLRACLPAIGGVELLFLEKEEEVMGVVVGMEYLMFLADVGMQVFPCFQD
jgi:hypothetical protein